MYRALALTAAVGTNVCTKCCSAEAVLEYTHESGCYMRMMLVNQLRGHNDNEGGGVIGRHLDGCRRGNQDLKLLPSVQYFVDVELT